MNRRFLLTSAAAVGLLSVAGCATTIASSGSIVDVAAGDPDFSTLVTAISAAGLTETLAGPGPFTVFAPTDAAFAALPAGTVQSLLRPENRDDLVALLSYHVVPGAYPASALAGERGRLDTLEGGRLRMNGRNGVRVDGATVRMPDIVASNGVIHAIDTVLMP
ncbi:fasciclin domain-containing protein [Sulfitobacter sp. HNIBRBA3233]|uniref:fasciclin domain-containing protein n=1 Tax=Sulfitobacter marinivivus TaxID=3158558 RepID=UPI0032DE7F0E